MYGHGQAALKATLLAACVLAALLRATSAGTSATSSTTTSASSGTGSSAVAVSSSGSSSSGTSTSTSSSTGGTNGGTSTSTSRTRVVYEDSTFFSPGTANTPGSEQTFTGDLYDTQDFPKAGKVGFLAGNCLFLTSGPLQLCRYNVCFGSNCFVAEGTYAGSGVGAFPVLGGFGNFLGAAGVFQVEPLGDGRFKLTLAVVS